MRLRFPFLRRPRGWTKGFTGSDSSSLTTAIASQRLPSWPRSRARLRHEPAPPRPKLRSCDLGMPRPFGCGHIVVPGRARPPGARQDQGRLRDPPSPRHLRPSLGTIVAMDGGPGYASTAKPYAGSLIAALGPILRRRDLVLYDMRGTGLSDRGRLPGPAGRPDPGIDRDRRVRQPARPALRRLHLCRSAPTT